MDKLGSVDKQSEKQLMLAGKLYHAFDPELVADRLQAKKLLHRFNSVLDPDDSAGRLAVLKELLGEIDTSSPPHIEMPFHCDYGTYISFGKDVFINFNCTILDCSPVRIGNRVLFGPNVSLFAATHPVDPAVRNGTSGPEYGKPVTICDDVWIGGNVTVLPGVTIGTGSTVGAGSVVARDVEPYTVVAGNPARLLRRLRVPNESNSAPA